MFARTAVTALPIQVVYSRGMSEPGYLKHRTEKTDPTGIRARVIRCKDKDEHCPYSTTITANC